jgi:thiamine biosynthesis lipoprotein
VNNRAFVFLLCAVLLCACTKQNVRTEFVLGTVCSVRFFENVQPKVFDSVFSFLMHLEDILSANREGSELDTINKNAGIAPVKVSHELIDVLKRALYFAELSSNGSAIAPFDPTVGPLVKLWNIGTDAERIPTNSEIQEALSLINWHDVEIDESSETVFLKKKFMALDLGAIAKGYAADEVAKIIIDYGIKSAVIDLGGNIFALGEKPASSIFSKPSAYKIGIQNPVDLRGTYIGYVEVKNKTLVTSGTYERFFEEGGIRYHHILSTQTGYPVWNDLLSVTIIAGNSMDADALSTTAFALGYEKGFELLENISDVEGIFILNDGSDGSDVSIKMTSGAEKIWTAY